LFSDVSQCPVLYSVAREQRREVLQPLLVYDRFLGILHCHTIKKSAAEMPSICFHEVVFICFMSTSKFRQKVGKDVYRIENKVLIIDYYEKLVSD
jgi:hypothetical protein